MAGRQKNTTVQLAGEWNDEWNQRKCNIRKTYNTIQTTIQDRKKTYKQTEIETDGGQQRERFRTNTAVVVTIWEGKGRKREEQREGAWAPIHYWAYE